MRAAPRLVKLACAALQQLDAGSAVSALTLCLEHPDATVRGAAKRALTGITGLDMPAEYELWRNRIAEVEGA